MVILQEEVSGSSLRERRGVIIRRLLCMVDQRQEKVGYFTVLAILEELRQPDTSVSQ